MSTYQVTTALLAMCETASEIASLLPRTDLVLDLDENLMSSWRILSDVIQGNHIYEEDLNYLIEKATKQTKNIERFKNASRKLDKKD